MNILFVFAHPDDEAYGPAGTISKLSKAGETVTVVSLCQGNRPGNEDVAPLREKSFRESCELLGAKSIMLSNSDCRLEFNAAVRDVEYTIEKTNPDIVYTHNISDLHRDHRVVAEACVVACRPKPESIISALYMCELPSSTDWTFGQIEPQFIPNTYVDVTDYMDIKKQVMGFYETEVYDFPDARSIESMEVLAKHRGKQVGLQAAESFKQIFHITKKG